VTVRNVGGGQVSNAVTFTYTETMIITGIANNIQPLGGPYSPVTIYGRGFEAPVAVSLAGIGAVVQSVSATELHVIPGQPIDAGCGDISGGIGVTNLTTGSSASGENLTFTYNAVDVVITQVAPNFGLGGTDVTILGINLPRSIADADVRFGGQSAVVTSAEADEIHADAPTSALPPPPCIPPNVNGDPQTVATVEVSVTDRSTRCTVSLPAAFQMQLPCVGPTPTPTP
jgi:hypothetical protein